jgi:hypothetical protein
MAHIARVIKIIPGCEVNPSNYSMVDIGFDRANMVQPTLRIVGNDAIANPNFTGKTPEHTDDV